MHWIQIVFPSFALCCAIFLLGFAYLQFNIYKETNYIRSKYLLIFCLIAAIPCLLHGMVQSRLFSGQFILYYCLFAFLANAPLRFYYLRTLSYFIAVPDWLLKFTNIALFLLWTASIVIVVSEIVGGPIQFADPSLTKINANYFSESIRLAIGTPTKITGIILPIYAFIDFLYSAFIFRMVWKSTRDLWFLSGLAFAIYVSLEHFILPVTTRFYLPLFFFSYFLEALRMNYLSGKEYIIETEVKKGMLQKVTLAKETDKYQNTNLSEERIHQLTIKLKDVLTSSKIYKDPTLRLEKLAAQVGVPGYQLSQVIGLGLKSRFYEVINAYRMEAVLEELKDSKSNDKSIIDIAFDNGFNSKSTFNSTFKKYTGKTPTEYRQEIGNFDI